MIYEYNKGDYLISTDKRKLQPTVIHNFLTNCYWSKGSTYQAVQKKIKNSYCYGIYHNKKQIGFCRVISDFITFAYLVDVFVVEEFRGRGLSKWLMECVMQHPVLKEVNNWMLKTGDAHGLYEKYGFIIAAKPDEIMEKKRQKEQIKPKVV